MAKYLWIGGALSGISGGVGSTSADGFLGNRLVDQYCFNTPGNWKLLNTATNSWVNTTKTPVAGDSVIFGTDNVNLGSPEKAGWQPAYSPCLFGGFSGGSAGGNWYFRGNSAWSNLWTYNYLVSGITATSNAIIGSSFNSGLYDWVFGVFPINGSCASWATRYFGGYNYPYFGGGITGEIAEWCALRDGVSASFYTKANSFSMFDPQENLKLKFNYAQIINPRVYLQSVVDSLDLPEGRPSGTSGGHINGPVYGGSSFGINYSGLSASKFMAEFDIATNLLPGISGSVGRVSTSIYCTLGKGAGVKINGKGNAIDGFASQSNAGGAPGIPYYYNDPDYFNPYSTIADYGVNLSNLWIGAWSHTKYQRLFMYGCTCGTGRFYPFTWDIDNTIPNAVYNDQVDCEVAADFDGALAGRKIYGLTSSAGTGPYYPGSLDLNYVASMLRGSGTMGYAYAIVSDKSAIHPEKKQTVIFGDRFGVKNHYINTVNMASGSNTPGTTGVFMYMPWALEFAGNARVTTINNTSSYVRSHPDIDGVTNTVRVYQMNMDFFADMDFSSRNGNFDDWRFGVATGNNQIAGGIVFLDEKSLVKGSAGVRLWNLQSKFAPPYAAPLVDFSDFSDTSA